MSERHPRPSYLRLIHPDDPPELRTESNETALAYTNRKGRRFFLHEGKTKTGKTRYFVARTVRDGALSKMPEGYEFSETINAVVSVRRIESGRVAIPDEDVEVIKREIARHAHLRNYRVEARGNTLTVYEPIGGQRENFLDELARLNGVDHVPSALRSVDPRRVRYEPVLKLERRPDGGYSVSRMSYRGYGGWKPLSAVDLKDVAERYIKHLGTNGFFELF